MTKITAHHLGRAAFVYIRQSTADQLLHNQESRRRQYGLADRARQLMIAITRHAAPMLFTLGAPR
jgi:hypothetical protein